MSHLLELAARCEQATGPSQLLDEEIIVAVRADQFPDARIFYLDDTPVAGAMGEGDRWGMLFQRVRYTASLDAAETLVPKSCHTELALQDRHSKRWKWSLRHGYGIRSECRAQTAPLALCAAALRARAAQAIEARQGGDGEAGSVHDSAVPEGDAPVASPGSPQGTKGRE